MTSRNILITGASSGIGAALAKVYARADNRLILWGRNASRLEQTALACRAAGAAVECDAFDISNSDHLTEKLERLDTRSPIDLAILNAGLGGSLPADVVTQSPVATRDMVGVNLAAPLVAANLLGERMAARKKGHLVFVSSVAGDFPLPMAPSYAATKAGVSMFSEALGIRLKPHGITVTLVIPGFIDTPMSRSLKEPRPFLISAEKAASIIAASVARRSPRVVLPWQFAFIRGFAALLPRGLVRAFLARV